MLSRPARVESAGLPGLRATLASILSVAVLTGSTGWLLTNGADWAPHRITAGLMGYAVVGLVVAVAATRRLRHGSFGLANQITLLRAGLACLAGSALLASGQAPSQSWSLAGLIALTLSLDMLDGWLARRLALTSPFGARFDMEVDALLLLILALLTWQTGRVDAWVLAIGLARYAFVLGGRLDPRLRRPLPESRRRQAVCVIQGVVLLLCLLPPVPPWLASLVAGGALALLLVSFAIDVRWLRRRPADERHALTLAAAELDRPAPHAIFDAGQGRDPVASSGDRRAA